MWDEFEGHEPNFITKYKIFSKSVRFSHKEYVSYYFLDLKLFNRWLVEVRYRFKFIFCKQVWQFL